MKIQLTPFGCDIYQILKDVDKTIAEMESARAHDFTADIMNNLDLYMDNYEKQTAEIYKNYPILVNQKAVQEVEDVAHFLNQKKIKTRYNLDLRINQVCVELVGQIDNELCLAGQADLSFLSNIITKHGFQVTYSEQDRKTIVIIIFENIAKPMVKEDT